MQDASRWRRERRPGKKCGIAEEWARFRQENGAMKTRFGFLLCLALLSPLARAALDPATIERATGLKGALNVAEGVFKVTAPRNDVTVSVDGWTMPPFMGLTSWAAFKTGMAAEAMVMGDLVLFPDEVNPVMSAALGAGLNVTALHNHFFYDEPRVYFMHIEGEGTAEQLGGAVKATFDEVKKIRAASPVPAKTFGPGFAPKSNAIDRAALEAIFSTKAAAAKDGMVKFVFGRKSRMPCGCEVGAEMGVNTWAAFAGTNDDAVVDGDFCVLESELQPTLKSLRAGGIAVVAIHQHMTTEAPRYIFLHYWGKGAAAELAAVLVRTLALQVASK